MAILLKVKKKKPARQAPPRPEDTHALTFPVIDRPIQFPDDVKWMRGRLASMGIVLGDQAIAALYRRLSVDFYPFDTDPGDDAWLVPGRMYDLVKKAPDYLSPLTP